MTKKNSIPGTIKTVAVLCSGGDSPGMNCAIRAVVRTALSHGLEPYGIQKGYAGLLEGNIFKMNASSVGNIMQKGGTILQTSRCPEFFEPEIRKEAAHILKRKGIDSLVVIGGNGSYKGAMDLWTEHKVPVIGLPGTIDNDISATEYTIGFDTAVQTAVEAVDKIRDTASSHERTFIVEVMGRHSPAIALTVGVCTGAENIVLNTKTPDYEQIRKDIVRGMKRGKNSSIIIVAEGKSPGTLAYNIRDELKEKYKITSHVCILGHIQRGGNPTPSDRLIASQMGNQAVLCLKDGQFPCAIAVQQGRVLPVSLEESTLDKNEADSILVDLARTLSI